MNKKIGIIAIVLLLIGAFFYFDLGQYFSFEYLKAQQGTLSAYYESNKVLTIALFLSIYILTTALSLPGAAIMTLAGGAIFGLVLGTILVSIASTVGATLAFLTSRFILRDSIQNKCADKLKTINEGMDKDCLLNTSPSPRDKRQARMPSSA